MATLAVTNQIRNVHPGKYQVAVSLLSTDGTVLASKASAVSVPADTSPIDQDVPGIIIS